MLTLTRDQIRLLDRLAIDELGIPGIVLMENAARNVAQIALDLLESRLQLVAADAQVAVFCGGGNNGGDGYAAARHLANAGCHVTAYAATDPATLKGDALINAAIADKLGLLVPLHTPDHLRAEEPTFARRHLLIDALLGTGFTGQVREPLATLITAINAASGGTGRPESAEACPWSDQLQAEGAPATPATPSTPLLLAIDLPSGLDADTGAASPATIRAHLTVTLVAPKPGLLLPEARPYVGDLLIADIGAPPSLIARVLEAS